MYKYLGPEGFRDRLSRNIWHFPFIARPEVQVDMKTKRVNINIPLIPKTNFLARF